MVKPIPEGYHSVTPYLILNAAGDAIAFYKRALGAAEVMRMDDPSGKIHHAEISIGGSRIMLADEHPDIQALSPKTIGGSPVSIHLYVDDVDAAVERAVAAGAKLIRPILRRPRRRHRGPVRLPLVHRDPQGGSYDGRDPPTRCGAGELTLQSGRSQGQIEAGNTEERSRWTTRPAPSSKPQPSAGSWNICASGPMCRTSI
jgi:PhnB protein